MSASCPKVSFALPSVSRECGSLCVPWLKTKTGVPTKFSPGWGDAEIKGLIGEAFESAKRQGKFKPADLDGFVYDAGRTVGAANGIITTKIKIHVGRDGKNLHAFPWP